MKKSEKILNFDAPEDNLGYLFWQVSMRWQLAMNRGLSELDLTQTQFVVMAALHWLSLSQETVTQVDIANHARIDKMMTSKILRALQDRQFISRQEHATDTRAKTVVLTEAGIEVFKKANALVENVDNQYFRRLMGDKYLMKIMLKNLLEYE
jgi:DNA-binding MarR family transcriptional regulator